MESFERFVAVALESEGYVVSEAVKFPAALQTKKTAYDEIQTHDYEVDLVGARRDRLVLATVKSFFGSRGVAADHVDGTTTNADARKGYRMLNDAAVREAVLAGAASRYGYETSQIEMRLYVGRFAAPTKGTHEAKIRQWCANTTVGAGPIKVVGVDDVVAAARQVANHKRYRDNPVIVTLKVLQAAGVLNVPLPPEVGTPAT